MNDNSKQDEYNTQNHSPPKRLLGPRPLLDSENPSKPARHPPLSPPRVSQSNHPHPLAPKVERSWVVVPAIPKAAPPWISQTNHPQPHLSEERVEHRRVKTSQSKAEPPQANQANHPRPPTPKGEKDLNSQSSQPEAVLAVSMLPAIRRNSLKKLRQALFVLSSDNGNHVHFPKSRTFAKLDQSQQGHQKQKTIALLTSPQTEPSPFAIESVRLGCKFTTARGVNVIHRN
jgi:hypothetical protein